MTNAQKVVTAIKAHLGDNLTDSFTSTQIRSLADVWKKSFSTTMKSLRVDPGSAPKVRAEFRGLLDHLGHNSYRLSHEGMRKLSDSRVHEVTFQLPEATDIEAEGYWNVVSDEDERTKVMRAIAQRHGQPKFRRELLVHYNFKCAISGCDAVGALEAAHIVGYRGKKSNAPSNGILMRADLHTLFDLDHIGISPSRHSLVLAKDLKKSTYAEFDGVLLSRPTHPDAAPSQEALKTRWSTFVAREAGLTDEP